MKREPFLRAFLAAALCLAVLLCPAARAAGLDPPANGYVADVAGVLKPDTVEHIVSQNKTLTDATGAAIVVVTVDFLNGEDIADYATDLFNDWGIGDKDANNGVLILLAIGEEDYYVLQGSGLKSVLPASTLGDYAWDYLENDFASGDYDAGVHKLFDALYQWFESYYADELDAPSQQAPAVPNGGSAPTQNSGGLFGAIGGFFKTLSTVGILLLIVVILVLVVVAADGLRYRTYRRRYYNMPGRVYHPFIFGRPRRPRRPRPPRPPRPSAPPRPHRPSGGGFGGFSSGFGGGGSRGGGVSRRSTPSRRSSGSFGGGRSSFGGGRSGFGGGRSRGGGAGRRR